MICAVANRAMCKHRVLWHLTPSKDIFMGKYQIAAIVDKLGTHSTTFLQSRMDQRLAWVKKHTAKCHARSA
jgi:hypothetical protein